MATAEIQRDKANQRKERINNNNDVRLCCPILFILRHPAVFVPGGTHTRLPPSIHRRCIPSFLFLCVFFLLFEHGRGTAPLTSPSCALEPQRPTKGEKKEAAPRPLGYASTKCWPSSSNNRKECGGAHTQSSLELCCAPLYSSASSASSPPPSRCAITLSTFSRISCGGDCWRQSSDNQIDTQTVGGEEIQ